MRYKYIFIIITFIFFIFAIKAAQGVVFSRTLKKFKKSVTYMILNLFIYLHTLRETKYCIFYFALFIIIFNEFFRTYT